MRIKTRLLIFLIPAIFFTLAMLTFISYLNANNQAKTIAGLEAQNIALKQSELIFSKLRHAEVATSSLTFALGELRKGRDVSREAHTNIIKGVAASSPDYFGIWVLWEPNAFDGKDESFINDELYGNEEGRANAYWMMSNGNMQYELSDNYDIEHYYILPKELKRLVIIPPYRDMDTQDKVLMTSIAMPVMDAGKPLGVVGIDIGLDFIHGLISTITPYGTGYARLISDKGAIIAQPGESKKLTDKLPMVSDSLRDKIRAGAAFTTMETSPGGEAMQCLYTPVKLESFEAPWYFMVALPLNKVMAESNWNLLVQLGISLLALLVLVGLVFYTANGVSRPLRHIADYAKDVAGGNHGARIDQRGFVLELKELQSALGSMLDSLLASMSQAERRNEEARREAERAHTAVALAEKAREASEADRRAMHEIAGRVNAVSEKLQQTSHDLSHKITFAGREVGEQNNLMAETVVAISGMADSVARVSDNAGDAARFTEQTRERAKEGETIVNHTLEAFVSIRREAESLGGQIDDLSVRSESVGNILGMINDIADQTNLLALNAAIEAARAGEAGRGFAVVADEVRKLAEKTVEATKQVEEAINGIRSSMQVSAAGVARTVKTVNDTVALGTSAQSALAEIVTLVQGMSEQINDIARLCRQQAGAGDDVMNTVERLRQLSISVSDAMEESAAITRTLEPEAKELGLLVDQLSKK